MGGRSALELTSVVLSFLPPLQPRQGHGHPPSLALFLHQCSLVPVCDPMALLSAFESDSAFVKKPLYCSWGLMGMQNFNPKGSVARA